MMMVMVMMGMVVLGLILLTQIPELQQEPPQKNRRVIISVRGTLHTQRSNLQTESDAP